MSFQDNLRRFEQEVLAFALIRFELNYIYMRGRNVFLKFNN